MSSGTIGKFAVAVGLALVLLIGFITVMVDTGNEYGITLSSDLTDNQAAFKEKGDEYSQQSYSQREDQESTGIDEQATDAAQLGQAYATGDKTLGFFSIITSIARTIEDTFKVPIWLIGILLAVLTMTLLLAVAAFIRGANP